MSSHWGHMGTCRWQCTNCLNDALRPVQCSQYKLRLLQSNCFSSCWKMRLSNLENKKKKIHVKWQHCFHKVHRLGSRYSHVWSRTRRQPEMLPSPGRLPIQILERFLLLEGTVRLFFAVHSNNLFHLVICVILLSKPSAAGAECLLLILFNTVALFDGGLPCDKSSIRRLE